MSEMKPVKYKIIKDGEWFKPTLINHKMACCDCGLVHNMTFRIVDENGKQIKGAKVLIKPVRSEVDTRWRKGQMEIQKSLTKYFKDAPKVDRDIVNVHTGSFKAGSDHSEKYPGTSKSNEKFYDALTKQQHMKKKPKSPKLKRYYLRPFKAKGVKLVWMIMFPDSTPVSKDTPNFYGTNKANLIREFAAWIRSHGGGSLRIMLRNGKFQQERTYPKGRDPRRSKG